MRHPFLLLALLLATTTSLFAQFPGRPAPTGRVYGKVVDEAGAPVGYATVQVAGQVVDPATQSLKDTLLAGQFTEDNGDFNIENLAVRGNYELVISFLGYAEMRQPFDFGGAASRDLGNLTLETSASTLSEVTVTAEASLSTLSLDRKSYRVDKDLSSAGGTAVDALKNVPSLSVDLDDNVSLRNGSPQVFIDGRPTTLSLDQISANTIESVEVITNPSAKFDAGGGAAGIVNIVLKKNQQVGYNGNLRVGGDSQGGYNLGGDLNARGEKVNAFASGMLMSNRRTSLSTTLRESYFGDPNTLISQTSESTNQGTFGNVRAGLDYFLDNRNTLTLSGSYMNGQFAPKGTITTSTDYLYASGTENASYDRFSVQDRNFSNYGAALQFKHLFPQPGAEWTADLSYNAVSFSGNSLYRNEYDSGALSQERQESTGSGSFLTLQSDFVAPLDAKTKLEGGIKATLRGNVSDQANFVNPGEGDDWTQVVQLSDYFAFNDNVFAGYLQAGREVGAWGFQAGLRAESSFYRGELADRDSSFSIDYPLSLFPSAFITRKLNETDQLQLAYTRRVNRPNFFQTMPFTDFSDSLNLRRGNPQLLPEFTTSLELSYQNIFPSGNNLLVSVYYKQATDLIAGYQFTEFNETLGEEVIVTSYANTDQATAYGAEATLKTNLFGWLDLTSNLNVYQSNVNASNLEAGLQVNRMSAFLKETAQIRLPNNFALQLNGEYRSQASFTPTTNNDAFRGGGGGTQNTAQGYTQSVWFVDASLRKSFWDNAASLTLSVQDVFGSREFGTFTQTDFFSQETSRLMNPQTVRLNFAYRFGKMDTSLFQRKNTNNTSQGGDMIGG
ncbi:outer membrane receptor for ferrienterochelin and colicin [Lewinella marina]|uniref:TonB-dependent receptor n=1 Tax=Neolewinella marina TaxID=438751 RepID=A0A2G0CAV1_9BACT|nr:outer membrane beta-barrel family protein [Neolewinella marina]NJB85855.1 outer membrane receptor for ferrienterochelin and colicin [Neolewinella marina]PHK97094.1 TonB-dependent receptor [Neolewinella marina]